MSSNFKFDKNNLELYLKEVAKDYKKRAKGMKAEVILVGGAAIFINYSFRGMSYDIDAIYDYPYIMEESINAVGDKFGLPNGWLNDDFKKTKSYTPKIIQYSKYYKTYSNVLAVRTIQSEYLVAMKLVSSRLYKNDFSDIVGIIYEQKNNGNEITYDKIDIAMNNLYGGWNLVNEHSKNTLNEILNSNDLESLMKDFCNNENTAKNILMDFIEKNPVHVNQDNVNDIIEIARRKQNKEKH